MKGSFPLVIFTNSGISIAEGCKVINVMNSCTVCFYFVFCFSMKLVRSIRLWRILVFGKSWTRGYTVR